MASEKRFTIGVLDGMEGKGSLMYHRPVQSYSGCRKSNFLYLACFSSVRKS